MACSADGGAAAAAPGPEAAPCPAGPADLVAAGTGTGAGAGAAAVWAGWVGRGCGGAWAWAKRSRRRRLAAASSAARLPPPSPRPAPCCRLSPRDLPRPRPPAEVPAAARPPPPQLVVCGPTGAMRLLPRRGTLPPARPGSDSAGGARRRGRASHRCCSAPAAESATIAVGSISAPARVGLRVDGRGVRGEGVGCAHAPVSSAIGTASAIGPLRICACEGAQWRLPGTPQAPRTPTSLPHGSPSVRTEMRTF